MESPTLDQTEILTGLGAAGTHLILAFVGESVLQGHPLVPVLQVGHGHPDLDIDLERSGGADESRILRAIGSVAARQLTPRVHAQGLTAFQVSRGMTGISV